MTILAHSLDGCLRLKANLTSGKGVVELRSHLYPTLWTYCVWRSLPLAEAWDLFNNQTMHHVNPHQYHQPVVQPGV